MDESNMSSNCRSIYPHMHVFTHWFRVWTAGRWWGSGPFRWHEPLSPPPSAATHTARTPASPAPLPPGCTPHQQTACRQPTCPPARLPADSGGRTNCALRGGSVCQDTGTLHELHNHPVTEEETDTQTGPVRGSVSMTRDKLRTMTTHSTSGTSGFKSVSGCSVMVSFLFGGILEPIPWFNTYRTYCTQWNRKKPLYTES